MQLGHRNMTNLHHHMEMLRDILKLGGDYSSKFAIPLALYKEK